MKSLSRFLSVLFAMAVSSVGLRAQSFSAVSNSLALDLRQVVTINLGSLAQTYDSTPRIVTVSTSPAGAPFTITYAGASTPPVNAGTYPIVVEVNDATRVGRAEGILVVARAELIVTANTRRLLGQSVPALGLNYQGFRGGDNESVLDERPAASVGDASLGAVGDYPISISGGRDNNYNLVLRSPGTLRIIVLAGYYEALLRDGQGLPLGKLSLTVTTRNAFTGSLTTTTDSSALTFKGNLAVNIPDASGSATVNLPLRGRSPYRLDLRVTDALSATLRQDGVLVGEDATGVRLAAFTSRLPSPWTGTYGFVLGDSRTLTASSQTRPLGAGYASAKVDKLGLIKFTGVLADGRALTGSFKTDSTATYRFFARPYGSRLGSYVAGELDLDPHPQRAGKYYVSAARGQDIYWRKAPGSGDANYREGFGPVGFSATLDPWQAPNATNLAALLGLAGPTFAQGLGSPAEDVFTSRGVPAFLQFARGNKITSTGANGALWKATYTPATGVFKGSYVLSDIISVNGRNKTVRRTVSFSGMLRQGPANDSFIVGRGFFLQPALPGAGTPLSGEVTFAAQATGTVAGVIKDGLTGQPVSGALLRFESLTGEFLGETSTNAQGNYGQVLGAGERRVVVSLPGYVTTTLFISVAANETREADAVLFAPTRTGAGTVRGRVVNAFNANGIAGATVRLRSGVNALTGAVLQTVTADGSGVYSFQTAGGSFTVEATAADFATGYANVVAVGGATLGDQDVRLTPRLLANQIRIVLTWGASPLDLDSHLAGPAVGGGSFHVYYSNDTAGSQAVLDVDDTVSYGPETITLSARAGGTYRYWVHDYSNGQQSASAELSQRSGAKVVVYRGVGNATIKVAEFNVPTGRVGNAWVVFDLDGATGVITPRNIVGNVAGASTIP